MLELTPAVQRCAAIFLVCGAALSSAPALAACHIAAPDAQLCQSGIAAATAFQRMRDAHEKAQPIDPGTVKLLRLSGCVAAGVDYATSKVEEVARGPVATPTGKLDVVSVRLGQNAYWYIAAESLNGNCTDAAGSAVPASAVSPAVTP